MAQHQIGLGEALWSGLASGTLSIGESIGSLLHFLGAEQRGQEIENWFRYRAEDFALPKELQGYVWDKPELASDPRWWAYSIGNVVPSIAAAFIPGGAAARGAKMLGMAPKAARGLGALVSGLSGGTLEGMGTYREARDLGLENPRARGLAAGIGTGLLNAIPAYRAFAPLGRFGLPGKALGVGLAEGITEAAEEPYQGLLVGQPLSEGLKAGLNVFGPAAISGMLLGPFGQIASPQKRVRDQAPEGVNIYGGVRARGAPLARLGEAQSLDEQGMTQEQTWRQTGWFKGPEGKWRFEIPDTLASIPDIDKLRDGLASGKTFRLGEVFRHDALFNAYPELANIEVAVSNGPAKGAQQHALMYEPVKKEAGWQIRDNGTGATVGTEVFPDRESAHEAASFLNVTKTGKIALGYNHLKNASPKDLKRTLLHEVQHLVQGVESFSMGGTVQEMKDQYEKDLSSYRSFEPVFDTLYTVYEYRKNNKTGEASLEGVASTLKNLVDLGVVDPKITDNLPEIVRVAETMSASEAKAAYQKARDHFYDLKNRIKKSPFQRYQDLVGETEARDVETRSDLAAAVGEENLPTPSIIQRADDLVVKLGESLTSSKEDKETMITWEVRPSTKADFGQWVSELPLDKQRKFTEAALGVIKDENGNDLLAKMLGVNVKEHAFGLGAYEGKTAANVLTTFDNFNDAFAYSRALEYIFTQDAAPFYKTDRILMNNPNFAQGVAIQFGESLTDSQIDEIYDLLREKVHPDIGFTVTEPNEIEIINFLDEDGSPWMLDNRAFADKINKIDKTLMERYGAQRSFMFGAETEYKYHDWKKDPQGESLLQEIGLRTAGTPGVVREEIFPWLRARREAFRKFTEDAQAIFDPKKINVEKESQWSEWIAPIRGTPAVEINNSLTGEYNNYIQTGKNNNIPIMLRNYIAPANTAQAEIIGTALEALKTIPDSLKRSVIYGVGDKNSTTQGVYYPGANTIGLREDILESLGGTLSGNEVASRNQLAARLYIAHELGHAFDYQYGVNGTMASSVVDSPSFGIMKDSENTYQLGDVINEMYHAYKDNKGGLREYLKYPFKRIESQYYMTKQSQREWIQYEAWAQLYSLHHVIPDVVKEHIPTGFKILRELDHEIKNTGGNLDLALRKALRLPDRVGGPNASGPRYTAQTGLGVGETGPGSQAGEGTTDANARRAAEDFIGTSALKSRYGSTERLLELDLVKYLNKKGEAAYPELMEAARGGRQTMEEITALADNLGRSPQWVRRNIVERKVGEALNAPGIRAAMDFLVDETNKFKDFWMDFMRKRRAGEATDQDYLDAYHALQKHAYIQAQISGIRSEAGRALGVLAHTRTPGGKFTQEQIDSAMEAFGGKTHVDDVSGFIEHFIENGDTAELNRFVQDAAEIRTIDKVLEAWINALLSGPQTHVVNMTSNAIVSINDDIVRFVASVLGKFHGGSKVYMREAIARMSASGHAAAYAADLFTKALKDENFAEHLTKLEARHFQAIGGVKGKIIRIPGRLLSAEDMLFKGYTYVKELHALAMREHIETGTPFQEILQGAMDEVPEYQSLRDKAWAMAHRATFTEKGGDITRAIQRVLYRHPSGRFIMPFIRTPANIVKYAMRHSLLAPVFQDVRMEIAQGGAARDIAYARIAWGTGVMGLIGYLATQGLVTGGGPDDPRERQNLYAQGWQPYSIKIGDRYYAYGRLEPLGMLFGIAADMREIADAATDPEVDEIWGLVAGSIMKNITSKTWLRGLSELIMMVEDPDRYGDRYIQNFLGTVVPTGVAQVARTQDPIMRRVETIMERIRSRIPGKSKDLLPRLDLWGRPIKREGGVGPDILSPVYISTAVMDPAAAAMREIGYFPGTIRATVNGIEITPEMHNRLIEMARKPAKVILDRLVQTPGWRAMPKEIRHDIMKAIIDRLASRARKMIILENPEYFVEQLRKAG